MPPWLGQFRYNNEIHYLWMICPILHADIEAFYFCIFNVLTLMSINPPLCPHGRVGTTWRPMLASQQQQNRWNISDVQWTKAYNNPAQPCSYRCPGVIDIRPSAASGLTKLIMTLQSKHMMYYTFNPNIYSTIPIQLLVQNDITLHNHRHSSILGIPLH